MNKKSILYSIDEDITIKELKKINTFKIDKNKEEKLINYCKKNNINSVFGEEIDFKKTKPIPYILYYIGNLGILKNKKIIGIVGSREINKFIEKQLQTFFEKIKDFNDIVIISGLADGTDSLAHNLSIKYNIPTISVLGFGLAKGLNGTSRYLIENIVKNNGLVISEFKLKQTGTNWTFPQRNRIIAGLSDILFVPQAKENSGTFITINKAIEYNIPVYSCFSSIDDQNGYGTNKFIKYGKINGIFDIDIFTNELKEKFKIQKNIKQNITTENNINNELNKIEKIIFSNIKKGNNNVDLLAGNLNLEINEIINTLSNMELNGIIEEDNGEYKIIL